MEENIIFTTEMFEDAEIYWKNKLSGELVELDFIGNYPRTNQYESANYKISLEDRLVKELTRICKNNHLLLNVMLLSVLKILLYRITGQEDIIVSSPVLKTGSLDYNKWIALRDILSPGMSFKELLLAVKETVAEGYKYQYYPIRKLIKLLKTGNNRSLFKFIFLMDNIHEKEFAADFINNSENDIIFSIGKNDEVLAGEITYNERLFNKETIQKFHEWYISILTEVVKDPNIKLQEISLVSDDEKKKLLVEFNDTRTGYPQDKTIDQIFQEQVEKKGNECAVVEIDGLTLKGKRHMNYRELHERANRLAILLGSRGVTRGSVIGLLMGHSLEMPAGMLGILKAGCIYLPIDPGYPADRINYMLKDSGSRILLMHSDLFAQPGDIRFTGEIIDVNSEPGGQGNKNQPGKSSSGNNRLPGNPAYAIYTSGSTGKPKGVLVEHNSVIRLVKNTNFIDFSSEDRMLPTGALAFDISTFEIWGPLLNGIRMVLADEAVILDAEKLARVLAENQVTILHLIPQLFSQMTTRKIEIFAGLKYALVGGDVVRAHYISEVRNKYPGIKILQMYGPTENTTFSTFFSVDKDYNVNIPIGRPISNSTVYILDKFDQLQPIGIVGELCTGGDGVAMGYLNNPELTNYKFSINKKFCGGSRGAVFQKSPPGHRRQKLYKTGDMARWLANGNIEFIGRRDNQVKIRGFRVELAEIEQAVLNHEKINEAVIITKTNEEGNPYLCAYFTSGEEIETGQLRDYLSRELPGYMVPLFFIRLDKLPLTPNGKIDRKVLPEPKAETGDDYKPPRDSVEKILVEVWSEVLHLDQAEIGINSDFFQLGGDSLKATLLISKIHQRLKVKISIAEIFKIHTIMELSKQVRNASPAAFISIKPAEKQEYYQLSSAQKRLYILTQLNVNTTSYNIPHFIELEGELNIPRLEETFEKLIKRHGSFRTSFELVDGEPLQKIHHEVAFHVQHYHLEAKAGGKEERIDRLIKNFICPFDLARAPLLRVGLIKIGKTHYILVADMHHIISDGTSTGILFREFSLFYQGQDLPLLRLQYHDFSDWWNRRFRSEGIKQQEGYWENIFKEPVPALNFPTDYPRPPVLSIEGDTFAFAIEKSLVEKTRQMISETRITLYMLGLAVYNVLLMKYTGIEDIVVGTGIAGRQHVDLQDIVGLFANMLAIRNRPRQDKNFIQFLDEVRKNTLLAYENQDLQFEQLIEKLKLPLNPSRKPLFDSIFQVQNVDVMQIPIPGLTAKPNEYNKRISHYDLLLVAIEEVDRIIIWINYSTVLFKPHTIEKIAAHYREILEQVVENKMIKIKDINLFHDLLAIESDFLDDNEKDFQF